MATVIAVPARAGVSLDMRGALNGARRAHHVPPLRRSRSLERSARRYAAWMLRADYFGHVGRIRATSRFRRLGETLAIHFGGGARVRSTVRRWLRSPPHRRVLLSRRFRYVGAGMARGRYHGHSAATWVLHCGRQSRMLPVLAPGAGQALCLVHLGRASCGTITSSM